MADITNARCNKCNTETKHSIKAAFAQQGFDGCRFEDSYQVLQCMGCDALCVRRVLWLEPWDFEDTDAYGRPVSVRGEKEEYFPPRTAKPLPEWMPQLPADISETLVEVFNAFNADMYRLTMMGVRAAIDRAMVQLVGDEGTYEARLKLLVGGGFVSDRDKDHLEAALEAGHAAIHRGHGPTRQEVVAALDLMESFVQRAYIGTTHAQLLRAKTPPRRRRKE